MNFKLEPEKSALIVFDMVNHFLMPGSPAESVRAREELVPRLKPLIAACRRNGVLVVYTGQSSRADGSNLGLLREIHKALGQEPCIAGTPATEVYKELATQPGDIIISKPRFDAFYATDLELILRQRKIDTVIITGTSTSIGTETTARGAVVRDFRVVFPADGTANRDLPDVGWGAVSQQELLKVVLTELDQFCRVCPIAEIISELDSPRGATPRADSKSPTVR